MADANARINIDINTSAAAAGLRQLQSQITAFNSTLTKSSAVQATAMRNSTQNMLELVNASRFFTAETVRMQTAAASLDTTLKKGQVTLGTFLGAKFRKNGLAAAQVMSLANTRAQALQTQFVATGAAANGMRDAIAIRPLQAFNNAAVVSAQKLAIHRAMLNQATTSMINFGKNTQWTGRQLMVGFTVPLTIFGGVAGKVFRDLEKEAVNFKKVYGDSFTPPEEMEANLNAVKELAKEYTKYGIAVKDTVGLAAEAAAAGAQNAELIDATTQATRLATLGQMEQNEALKTTISLQNAFKLSGDELANSINFLNMVENQTVVTLQDLSGAIPRVAPVIKGLGGDVRDLATFLAAMQEGGVSAAQGSMALKSGLASLINPTDKAKEKLSEMGISIDTIIQANKGDLMGTVQALAAALDTLDQFGRQQAIEQLFGKFQYARLAALFDNINKEGTQASRVMEISAMSAAEMAASAEKELGAIEEAVGTKFVAAMEQLKLAIAPIGEMFTKMAIPVVNFLAKIADAFNKLPDGAKTFVGIATAIVGLVIPAGTMFLGLLVNLVGTLVKFGSAIGTAFRGFLSGGIKGAFDAVSQSTKYMSLAEIDAANSAQQLAGSTEAVNMALLEQVGASETAQAAVMELAYAYEILTQQMREAAVQNKLVFGVGAGAMGAVATRGTIRRNRGGTIPGSGNTDTVPAMLTPGEFVVNKQATQDNLGLLRQINEGGKVPGYRFGGMISRMLARMFSRRTPRPTYTTPPEGATSKGSVLQEQSPAVDRPLTAPIGTTGVALPAVSSAKRLQAAHFGSYTPTTAEITALRSQKVKKSARLDFAETLSRSGIPVIGLTDDWVVVSSALNQAAKRRTTKPMTISEAIDDLSANKESLRFGPAMGRLGVSPDDFVDELAGSLYNRNKNRLGSFITDIELEAARDAVYGRFGIQKNLKGVRMPGEIELFDWASKRKGMSIENITEEILKTELKKAGFELTSAAAGGKRSLVHIATGQAERLGDSTSFKSSAAVPLNKGGSIVPGQGNKDTVPAMLTPGEFVINKKATQSNLALLKAINNGTIKGYAAGDIVEAGADYRTRKPFYHVENPDGSISRFENQRDAKKASKAIVRSMRGGGVGSGMGRGMGMSMGMGMIGSTAMMGGMMLPGVAESPALSGAVSAGGMGLSMLSMLPMMGVGGPATLAIAGIAAAAIGAGVAIKAWRESVDNAARTAAEFGANLGGTANALNNIAELTGQQTPLQRRRQVGLGITNAEMENIMSPEMSAMLTSEKGQALIEELKSVTSAERFQKLSDYLKSAIASGLMDRETATSFAKAISFEVQDSLLGRKTATAISSQDVGAEAFLELAQKRGSAADALFDKFENEFDQAAKNVQTGIDASLSEIQDSVKISGPTPSQVIGLAMQGIQDYANVQALAQEEFARGTINLQKFTEITKEASEQQQIFTTALKSAIEYAADPGAAMQGAIDQLRRAGFTEEDVKSLEEAAKVKATGQDFSIMDAKQASKQLKGFGIAALLEGTDIVTVNSALRDLADTAVEGTNAMRIAFDKFGNLPDAIAKVSISQLLGGQVPVEEAQTQSALDQFIEGGGDTARLQGVLASMSQQEAAQTFNNLVGLGDPAQQNQFMSDFEAITEAVDSEYATQIVNSEEYLNQLGRGQTALVDDLKRAKDVFGESTKEIITYADNTGNSLKELTEKGQAIADLPDELAFRLGVEVTNIEDLEKIGPMADELGEAWPILSKLPPEINMRSFVEANTTNNGKLVSSEDLAKEIIKIDKAYRDLDSTKPKIVKEALVDILVAQGASEESASDAINTIISEMENFNKFLLEDKLAVITIATRYIDAKSRLDKIGKEQFSAADYQSGAQASVDIKAEQDFQRELANAEGAAEINRRRAAKSTQNSGGGTPEKTIAEQLEEQRKLVESFADRFGSKRGVNLLAKPFGPEFLQYLKSQGQKGLDMLKGNFKKMRSAYKDFAAAQKAESLVVLQFMPGKLTEELEARKNSLQLIKQIAKEEGMSLQTATQAVDVLDATQQADYISLISKKKLSGRR